MIARTARDGIHAMADLPQLLPKADSVVVTVSYNEGTHHLVDAKFLATMRQGAILINLARGPVIDTDALLASLNAHHILAGLDVTDPEPLPDGHPLWFAPGCLITPHVAGVTLDADRRGLAVGVAQLEQLARGQRPANVVPAADLK
jgi:phosphoglycerate dehydrogenase-like enzyme